jgi:coenzyme PQQ precursor peptide PqqA
MRLQLRTAIFPGILQNKKIPLANFSRRGSLMLRTITVPVTEWRGTMAWKAPKIVEVPVGMEINMYACAARK